MVVSPSECRIEIDDLRAAFSPTVLDPIDLTQPSAEGNNCPTQIARKPA